jgi:hypothetical protein
MAIIGIESGGVGMNVSGSQAFGVGVAGFPSGPCVRAPAADFVAGA